LKIAQVSKAKSCPFYWIENPKPNSATPGGLCHNKLKYFNKSWHAAISDNLCNHLSSSPPLRPPPYQQECQQQKRLQQQQLLATSSFDIIIFSISPHLNLNARRTRLQRMLQPLASCCCCNLYDLLASKAGR